MVMDKPKLRALEAIPQEVDGQPVFHIRDPQGLSPNVATLSPELARFLFTYLDGSRTVLELGDVLEKLSGQRLDLAPLVEQLDEALFLESPAFLRHVAERLRIYREQPARPAIMGSSYPEDLRGFLDGLYEGLIPPAPAVPVRAVAIPHLSLIHI